MNDFTPQDWQLILHGQQSLIASLNRRIASEHNEEFKELLIRQRERSVELFALIDQRALNKKPQNPTTKAKK